ncbi:hypothetical protein E8E11_007204 [Didymella keratinophila]|nr:hypothetical protein E8E11_007204 [Didymella keratinophila]
MATSWSTDFSEVVIGVVGVTGSGKSSFIKLVTQCHDINTSGGPESDTQNIGQYRFQAGGTRYVLVDTPGFDDSVRDDEDVYIQLARWTAQSFRAGQYMNGILYLHPVTSNRHRGSELRNLRMFKKLCGNNNFGNVVLGLTFCDIETEANIRSRQQELSSTPEWWGDMIALGSRVERIPHQRDTCIQMLSQFRPQPKVTLKIQKEVVVEGRDITQTDAAKTIAHKQELERIRAQEARQFADLRAEYERKMRQARETYESTLRLAQQRFEMVYQRQQMQEQAYKQSNQRQEELHRKVSALHAENEAQKQANNREIARLQEQLRLVRLESDQQRGEVEFEKIKQTLLDRAMRIQNEWAVVAGRKNAFRMKQPYEVYATTEYDGDETIRQFTGNFCDRCLKSYSPSEDFYYCCTCNENWDLCVKCWGKGATCQSKYHDLHVISHCPSSLQARVDSKEVLPTAETCTALFDYDAKDEGDLSFGVGDTIEIVKKTQNKNDWWTGKLGGKQGMFPANYVKLN